MLAAALAAALAAGTALDLSPVFAGERGRAALSALTLLREGRNTRAAAELRSAPGPHAAWLRARALVAAGQPKEALSVLEGLEVALPEIGDRVLHLRGQALLATGRAREAMAAWQAVGPGSLLGPDAALSTARVAEALGDRGRALAALEPILGLPAPRPGQPDPAAAALLLAGRLRAVGRPSDPAGARRDLMACWSEHPLAPEATACLSAARTLPGPHGAPPGPELAVTRAERLLEVNRTGSARAALRGIRAAEPSAEDPLSCRVRAALGRAHRRDREHRLALAALEEVIANCTEPAVVARVLYVAAGSRAISGDREAAIGLHRSLAARFPGSPLADDALLAAADLLAGDGRVAEARQVLADLVREFPSGDVWDEARFRLGWLARREGDLAAAVAAFSAIEATELGVDPYEHARAAYWRARLLAGRDGQGMADARAVWAELVARYPADYYGLLARARLAEAASGGAAGLPAPLGPEASVEPSWEPGPLATDPHLLAGVLLLRMGLLEDARAELGAVDLARLDGAGPEPLLVLAELLDRAGDHRAAHLLLRTRAREALPRAPRAEDLPAWRIAYPPAFREVVKLFAPPSGLPVDLLQALIREESALDPGALSPAGAIGLTQLMLPTARHLAAQAGLPRPSREDLMRAEVNVRLGARYLGQLVRRFGGSLVLALAAYNAGPTPVKRWVAERGREDLDAFVEDIPYDETRAYVKRVLRSYAAYRLLYGSPDEAEAALPLDLRSPSRG